MLILAGVSLNAIVGDNGIITMAQKAKGESEEANRRENLDFWLFEYNSNEDINLTFTEYLAKLKNENKIEDYIYYDGNLIIKCDGYYYKTSKNDDYYEIAEKMSLDLGQSGGTSKIVTPDNIKNAEEGKITFSDGDEFIVLDSVSVTNFNFDIPAKSNVTIKLLGDMSIDNSLNPGKAAINLGVNKTKNENGIYEYSDGATLNLYVYGNVTVKSSYALEGEKATGWNAKGGEGGCAGIRVAASSTLNLYGNGKLIVYGGNASDGNGTYGTGDSNTGGGRRRPELEQELEEMVEKEEMQI